MKSLFKSMKHKKIFLVIAIIFICALIVGISIFATQYYVEYKNNKRLASIDAMLQDFDVDKTKCRSFFDSDASELFLETETIALQDFLDKKELCNRRYKLSYQQLDRYSCREIIADNTQYLLSRYLVLDNYENIQKYCLNTFFKVEISQGKLFDELNDFKSQIIFDFDMAFYEDIGATNDKYFIENRVKAKQKFLSMLRTSSNISVNLEDIVLYPRKAIVWLDLQPNETYTFGIQNLDFDTTTFENNKLYYSGESIPTIKPEDYNKHQFDKFKALERTDFEITLPENKFLGIVIQNPVTLYPASKQPKFKILDYDSGKTQVEVKICRISAESYAKIEVMNKRNNTLFYQTGIDDIPTQECFTNNVALENQDDAKLTTTSFDFQQALGEVAQTGLYYVTFNDSQTRHFHNRYQKPLFFGIVNSHITMKVSQNGKAFFFVNDLKGNPLQDQKISISVNDFQSYELEGWRIEDRVYNSPLDTQIFQEAQELGVTNQDGVLEVNLKDFIQDGYQKTFGEWYSENYQGKFESFMVESSSQTHLSYSNSRFNAGIAPWNFGYSIDDGGYYDQGDDTNDIKLESYLEKQKRFLAHIFPERKLYLPGETAYIKAIIRDAQNLEIPTQTLATIKIFDPQSQEIFSTGALLNDFGSLSVEYNFSQDADLGAYRARVYIGEEYISETGMNVEVFQKPKFKTDVTLDTVGLDGSTVEITEIKEEKYEKYIGEFQIQANVLSQYYNGRMLQNADFDYKVYKQRYYPNNYWDDCYYGCYWEPRKEFYTQGTGSLNIDGQADFLVDIAFDSSYSDYKYIVEVSVEDINGDIISATNSIVAHLPEKYKLYNANSQLFLAPESKFVKAGKKIELVGGLNVGKWQSSYNDSGLIVVKKKDYIVEYIEDVRGKIPKNKVKETIVDIIPFNDSELKKKSDGKLYLDYKLKETGEYVFEYASLGLRYPQSQIFDNNQSEIVQDIAQQFIKEKSSEIYYSYFGEEILLNLDDIMPGDKKFFHVVAYGDESAKNPEYHDNKIQVLSEKVSYKPGETAKILVRLPYENTKVLWTIEKQSVVEYEYIDVVGNTFFKEVEVDGTFEPNAYIGVVMVDTRENIAPAYKVGYTEVVVDKSQKVSGVNIKTNKETYIPREQVEIEVAVSTKNNKPKQSELTIMVVDDSLISLLGNIDLNILEKVYKKLPFQIQTQLSSVAMFQNFYFSQKGLVGGSGLGSFKGGDSAISTRNIFKNTAYYNPSVITDEKGKAKISFELPDNITNFRVMVLSQSQDNYFGNAQKFISVRKNILIEDKMPLVSRTKDEIVVGANIFNLTDDTQGLEVSFQAEGVEIENQVQNIVLEKNQKEFVTWKIQNISNPNSLNYSIVAKGSDATLSDKIEKTIPVYTSPVLYTRERKTHRLEVGGIYEDEFELTKDIDIQNSYVELIFSNNKLYNLEKILHTLIVYPYGCIEQSVSSTYPNVIAKKLNHLFSSDLDNLTLDKNIEAGLERIFGMQNKDGGFSYWHGENNSNLTITPYVLRSLLDMKDMGVEIPEYKINNIISYLKNNINNVSNNTQKTEVFWALAQAGNYVDLRLDSSKFNRHELLAYTYALYYQDAKKNKSKIKRNIIKIQDLLQEDQSSYYWNKVTDLALFTQLLIDVEYDQDVIDTKIEELYDYDFESYYYSTKTKNAAFRAFVKYIDLVGANKSNSFGFSLGKIQNRGEVFAEGNTKHHVIKKKYYLEEMLYDDGEIDLKVANLWGNDMYVDFVYHKVPKKKEDIPSYSNKLDVSRTHYLVTDETKLGLCTKRWYRGKEDLDQCEGVFVPVENASYQKDAIYKSEIKVSFDEPGMYKDLVVEEFLASGFEIIQSNFKTQSVAVGEANRNNSWVWNYTQNLADRAMAHAKNVYGNELVYEFYFRPKYEGDIILPPVSAYLMYRPEIRAHSKFSTIEVK